MQHKNIEVSILADSIHPQGSRLTTFLLKYPLFIHPEFMTHRCFSRNAASSRAIPTKKLLDAVKEHPAFFEYLGKNMSGMSAQEEMTEEMKQRFTVWWHSFAENTASRVEKWSEYPEQPHKQMINRLLAPFLHITVVATATAPGLENFFMLRAHKDAQPEFQVLAYRMLDTYLRSKPDHKNYGDWHIPLIGPTTPNLTTMERVEQAVAQCARVSYQMHNGKQSIVADKTLHDKLLLSKHLSPFEHVAQATSPRIGGHVAYNRLSNFDIGGPSYWTQYRKMIVGECQAMTDDKLQQRLAEKPEWVTL